MINIYLDTQDYHNLSKPEFCDIKEFLLNKVKSKEVRVVCSILAYFEFIQNVAPENGENLKDRCHRACFVGQFTDNIECDFFGKSFGIDADLFIKLIHDAVQYDSIHPRKRVKELKDFEDYFSQPDVSFAKTNKGCSIYFKRLFSKHIFSKYEKKKVSKDCIQKEIDRIKNPQMLFYFIAEVGGIFSITDLTKGWARDIQEKVSRMRDVSHKSKIDNVEQTLMPPRSEIDKRLWMILENYLPELLKDSNRKIEDSEMIDIFHAQYLYECDLWRTDKHFAHSLRNHPLKHRIVSKLKCLPSRVNEVLKEQKEAVCE